MKTELVEIYSDTTNAAVLRHPARKFPGILIQGDTLSVWCSQLDSLCKASREHLDADAYADLNELRNALWGKLNHYKVVLAEHEIPLPFSDGL